MNWFTWFLNNFGSKRNDESVVEDKVVGKSVAELEREREAAAFAALSPLFKLKAKFNEGTDLLVISQETVDKLEGPEKTWVNSLGDKAIVFPSNNLINFAVIKSYGYGGSSYGYKFS